MSPIKLLQIEWMKVRYYRTFWFFVAAITLVYGFIVFLLEQTGVGDVGLGDLLGYEMMWYILTYLAGRFTLIFFGIFMVILIASEFRNRTLRQNVIDGMSKKEVIISKLMITLLISGFSLVMVIIMGLLYGGGEAFSEGLETIHYLGYYVLQSIAYLSLFLFLTILTRKVGMAIGLYIVYWIAESMLWSMMGGYANAASKYLPLTAIYNIIPLPLYNSFEAAEEFNTTGNIENAIDLVEPGIPLLIWVLIMVVGMYAGSYTLLNRRNL